MSDPEQTTTALAAAFEDAGWSRFMVERRAPERWAMRFGEMGLCSSITIRPGEQDYRLSLSKKGKALRAALIS